MAHKLKRGGWHPVKEPGSETRRAEEHGRSLHEQAEVDAKSPDKRIRGKGIFALNAQAGKFKHRVGKKKATRKSGARRTSVKRTARKRA